MSYNTQFKLVENVCSFMSWTPYKFEMVYKETRWLHSEAFAVIVIHTALGKGTA